MKGLHQLSCLPVKINNPLTAPEQPTTLSTPVWRLKIRESQIHKQLIMHVSVMGDPRQSLQ